MDALKWWQTAVFYQIYPRSFADHDGDGIGDLKGIIAKLDYLQSLGIDAVWLSPHYPSPLWDCGYDIADYTGVAPEYGSLDDFKQLLDGLHQRGIRLVLDLVLNHTSDQHPWFLESRSSRDNPKRDWYIWREGRNGEPPNNWYSTFGGPAWEYDERTGQYFYHFFFKQQPDLNWRNPQVRAAMKSVMRFWLELGVDGFRLDAIGTIFEDPNLPDQQAPISQAEYHRLDRLAASPEDREWVMAIWKQMFLYQNELPENHELMRELRALVDEYPDRVLVGEIDEISYYGNGSDELHMVFNFPLMKTNRLVPEWIHSNQEIRLKALPPGGWPCNTLGNHDSSRVRSHFGDGTHDEAIARQSLALMLTLKGTPFLYNGEEIGMSDLFLDRLEDFRDMLGVWVYETEIDALSSSHEQALKYAARATRDRCRTPLQWENAPNGGFCPAGQKPWLPANPDYKFGVNVQDQEENPGSLLNFYRKLIALRRENPALVQGEYEPVTADSPVVLAFLRRASDPKQTCLVVMNMSEGEVAGILDVGIKLRKVLYSSVDRKENAFQSDRYRLSPYEIVILEVY